MAFHSKFYNLDSEACPHMPSEVRRIMNIPNPIVSPTRVGKQGGCNQQQK